MPGILYPAVHPPSDADLADAAASWRAELPAPLSQFMAGPAPTFLSINRFERKKVSVVPHLYGGAHEPQRPHVSQTGRCTRQLNVASSRLQGIEVAVRALHELNLRSGSNGSSTPGPAARLVLAGGYDQRLAENRDYFSELQDLVAQLGLDEQVAP